jgi:hypothetical protein
MAAESERLAAKAQVEYFEIGARSILNRTKPGMPFQWTINPYRGCEFGCQYCYARYTHEFMGLEDGREFESKIYAKATAPEILRRELRRIDRREAIAIAIGTATDPYQPAERRFERTRGILQVFAGGKGRPGVHYHQVGSGHARYRAAEGSGAAQRALGEYYDHHAERAAGALDGAARAAAGLAAGSGAPTLSGGHLHRGVPESHPADDHRLGRQPAFAGGRRAPRRRPVFRRRSAVPDAVRAENLLPVFWSSGFRSWRRNIARCTRAAPICTVRIGRTCGRK